MKVLCAISDICAIWKIIVCMIGNGPSMQIYNAMIQFKVFRQMVKALNKVIKWAIELPWGYNDNEGETSRVQASETMGEVMFGMLLSTEPSRAIAQGIYGGLHHYLIHHFLPHASTTSLQHRTLLDAYNTMSLHGIYCPVRQATIQSKAIPNEDGIKELKSRFLDFKTVFHMLDYANKCLITMEESVAYLRQLCDNPMVSTQLYFFFFLAPTLI